MKTSATTYGVTLVVVVLAGLARWLLDPILGDRMPYPTFFVAVIFATWYGGLRPAIFATVMGFFGAMLLFASQYLFRFGSTGPLVGGAITYFVVCLAIAVFGDAMRKAQHLTRLSEQLVRQHAEDLELALASIEDREQQFRLLAESIPQLAWMANPDGHIFWYNRRWYDYTGTTFEQMEGWGWQSVHDPAVLPNVLERWKASIETCEPFDMVFPLRSKSGEFRSFLTRVMPVMDESGRVKRWFGTNTDITESILTEKRLTQEQERLNLALGAADLGQWELSLPNQNTQRTLRHDQIFGYDALLPEWTYELFLAHVLPEDRASVDESFKNAVATGTAWNIECRIRRVDGEERWIWTKARIHRDSGGRVKRMLGIVGDCTERKQVEEEAREARSRLESTLAAGEIGTWEFDTVHNTLRADKNLARMFGVTTEEAVRGPLEAYLKAVHPDDKEALAASLGRAIETGDCIDAECRLVTGDDTVRWVVARGRVERDASGRAVRLPGVVVDITQRRKIEGQLRESEERRRLALDSAELGAWHVDPSTMKITTDDRFRAIFGVTDEQLDYQKVLSLIHPDDQSRVREAVIAATRPDDPIPYAIEYRVLHSNGSIRWVFAKGRANYERQGSIRKLASFDGTIADITDRKMAEAERQKLSSLVEISTDFIGLVDLEAMPFYVNKAGLEMVGLDILDDAVRTPLREFFFPEDQSKIMDEFFPTVIASGHGEIEIRFRHFKTGSALWMLFRVFALADAQGKRTGMATVSRDITQRRQLEDNLRTLATDLSEAGHRKDEFLATLAHELRNPLAPIRNGLQLMRMAGRDEATVEQVRDMMERQLTQLVRLVDDLMDVSRISRGKIELRTEQLQLSSILHSAVETSRPFIEEMGQELSISLPDEPILVEADMTRLAQVFMNLLNNAAKYSDRGSHIWLSAKRNGKEVTVTVRDNGIGIAADQFPRLFEMFSQVDRSLEKSHGGLGIGLSLVKRLVEMHGGSIEASSEGLGKGSTFSIHLPIVVEANETQNMSIEKESAAVETRLRILVVDDNRDGANSLAMMLEVLGNETHTAYDGEEAVAKSTSLQPAVILLDIGLPKLNGYEACRRIRAQPGGKDIVIIAQTGWGQDEDRQRTHHAGFDHHMVKPVDPVTLMNLLVALSPR